MKLNGLVGLAVLLLAGCGGHGGGGSPPPVDTSTWQPSLAASAWFENHSPGQPNHPSAATVGFSVGLPVAQPVSKPSDCTCVGYVQTQAPAPLVGKSITLTVQITAAAGTVFDDRTDAGKTVPGMPAMRLLLERKGDTLDGSAAMAQYRLWAGAYPVYLAPGTFTVTVPLDWQDWTGVFGGQDAQSFADMLSNIQWIGLSFGGDGSFGHGAFIDSGTATVTVTGFTVNR